MILLIVCASFTTIVTGTNNSYTNVFQNTEKITNTTLFHLQENIDINQDVLQITNITKNYWAVLIGLNNYPGTENDLPFSVTEITSKEGNQKRFNTGGDLSLLSANVYA